jgi:hypothetical protein
MIGKVIGAVIGERIAQRYGSGARGAVFGALAPVVARRLMGPLGLALAGVYVAKKLLEHRRKSRGNFSPSTMQ